MPDTALTTRVTEETYRRLKVQAAQTRRTIQEIVEAALRQYLAQLELPTVKELLEADA